MPHTLVQQIYLKRSSEWNLENCIILWLCSNCATPQGFKIFRIYFFQLLSNTSVVVKVDASGHIPKNVTVKFLFCILPKLFFETIINNNHEKIRLQILFNQFSLNINCQTLRLCFVQKQHFCVNQIQLCTLHGR